MNPSIDTLHKIASKPGRIIIGLMSGTSLDGLDIALCRISGSGTETKAELLLFESIPYDSQIKNKLKSITSVETVSLEEVCLLHSWLGDLHGEMILQTLEKWEISPAEVDCIASHGQTIFHAPKSQHRRSDMPNSTLQIGDGDHIAWSTGILTLSDFRQKHTAAGGEGAPMAALVDELLYRDETTDRVLLNIGGIANFTYLPARSPGNGTALTTDTGPGNTLIDQSMREFFSRPYDQDGEVARSGTVHQPALIALKSDPFFERSIPKTTGPEVFNLKWVIQQLEDNGLSLPPPEDLVATLTRLSAETIAESIQKVLGEQKAPVFLSGGGMHNPVLLAWIKECLPECGLNSFSEIGFNPDAKEAVIFAVLANEMLCGKGFRISAGQQHPVNFGKISFPD